MSKQLIKMVVVPPGKWTLVMSKGKGHLIKIGPFEEWVPRRVVEIAENGTLYISHAFLTPGRLWTAILKNYRFVKRPVADVNYANAEGGGGGRDDDDEDDMDIEVEYK
ncbi:MAG: hypothetical protein ABI743_13890, partial [bacterium]